MLEKLNYFHVGENSSEKAHDGKKEEKNPETSIAFVAFGHKMHICSQSG